MVTMIFDKTACGEIDENTTVVVYSKVFVFSRVEIGGKDNQWLQFALNAFYKDAHELSYAITTLWNLVNWSNTEIVRCNDIEFIFNRMIGYNTAFYDIDNEYWYLDEVNSQAETCYIKFRKKYFEYPRQTLRSDIVLFVLKKDNEVILPIVKVYRTAQVLEVLSNTSSRYILV